MPWAHDLSPWLMGPLIAATFAGAAIVGLAFTRRWSRQRGLHALVDNGVIGWIFSAILGIYAISIGLIAVATWGNVTGAETIAAHESAQIMALYRVVQGYPQPVRGELESGLRTYLLGVIEDDWPAQRHGIVPREGAQKILAIERTLYGFAPGSTRERLLHAEALRGFSELLLLRSERLDAVTSAVPASLWAVVLIGAALSIFATFVFSMESFRVHATMTGLLAVMISLLVFFIAVSDPPFRGRSGVSADPYALVLGDIDHRHGSPTP